MITITNNSIFRSDFSIEDYDNYENIETIEDADLLMHLMEEVQLGESLKFKRIFDIMSANIEVFNLIFYSSMGGHQIDAFLQEIQNIPSEKTDCEYLEVAWSYEDYSGDISISAIFHGIGKSENGEIAYALDFAPLNNLQNLNLRLNTSLELFKYGGKKPVFGKNLGDMGFTVFDLFGAVLYEISFHGGPNDKKEKFKELEGQLEEAEDSFAKDSSGKDYTDFRDMIKEIESKDIYLVKYKKLRERVNEKLLMNNDIEQLKNCLREKLKIYDKIANSNTGDDLAVYYKKLTDIEYNLQTLYGVPEDIKFHKFWNTPMCTCPKIDNIENYPSEDPFFDKNCPIHKK